MWSARIVEALRVVCLFAAVVTIVMAVRAQHKAKEQYASTQENALRQRATDTVRPEYPEGSLDAKIGGVAVAEVWVTSQGAVESVRLVETPGPAVSKAVHSAVARWRFSQLQPDGAPQAIPVTGLLTFYFDEASRTVRYPAEQARWLRGTVAPLVGTPIR